MPDPYREPTEETPSAASEIMPEQSVEAAPLPEKEKSAERGAVPEQMVVPSAAATSPGANAAQAPSAAQTAQNLRAYEKNQQLKALVDLAFQKGVAYASDVARQLDSPYLMDEFHDTLVDELHRELVQRGKLEEL